MVQSNYGRAGEAVSERRFRTISDNLSDNSILPYRWKYWGTHCMQLQLNRVCCILYKLHYSTNLCWHISQNLHWNTKPNQRQGANLSNENLFTLLQRGNDGGDVLSSREVQTSSSTLGRSALGNLKFYNINVTFQFFSSKNAVWIFLLNGILPQSVAWQRNIKSSTDK